MEVECRKSFKQIIKEKNEEDFYENFIVGDEITNYVVKGLGDDLVLNECELLEMLDNNFIDFDFIDYTYEYANLIINYLPIKVEVI